MGLTLVLQIIIVCMMLLRICALYEGRMVILAFPVCIAICATTIGVVGTVKGQSKEALPSVPFRCDFGLTPNQAHYLVGAFGGQSMLDLVILALTLYKALTLPRGSGSGLLTMIMRDGTVYFGVVTIFNLANILVLVMADSINRGALIGPMNIISSIMMTRLMLNLRDPQYIGKVEEFKTTTLNIRGFGRQTAGSGTVDGYSRSVHGDERSV